MIHMLKKGIILFRHVKHKKYVIHVYSIQFISSPSISNPEESTSSLSFHKFTSFIKRTCEVLNNLFVKVMAGCPRVTTP